MDSENQKGKSNADDSVKEQDAIRAAADQEETGTLPGGIRQEDMLDMTKGAANMDRISRPIEGVSGRTIGGTGSGPGTGDAGGDFDRPGTTGEPAINDFVSPEGLAESDDSGIPAGGDVMISKDDLPVGSTTTGEEASGYPGGGAVRTAEDKLPPGQVAEDAGFSPEAPLNK